MANIYKNAFFDLATTDKTDVYTPPSNSRAIVKTIQGNNHAGSNPELEVFVYDNSATTEYEISHKVIASKTFENMISGSLVLEENDVLRVQASTGGAIEGFVSILEINRD
jgi:hypothetical protein